MSWMPAKIRRYHDRLHNRLTFNIRDDSIYPMLSTSILPKAIHVSHWRHLAIQDHQFEHRFAAIFIYIASIITTLWTSTWTSANCLRIMHHFKARWSFHTNFILNKVAFIIRVHITLRTIQRLQLLTDIMTNSMDSHMHNLGVSSSV